MAADDIIKSAHEVDKLDTRIQALPQELQDEIFQHYIDSVLEGPTTVNINRTYKPPIQLQIDRESRTLISRLYYQHPRKFHMSFDDALAGGLFVKWLRNLSPSNKQAIDHIELVDFDTSTAVYNSLKPLREPNVLVVIFRRSGDKYIFGHSGWCRILR